MRMYLVEIRVGCNRSRMHLRRGVWSHTRTLTNYQVIDSKDELIFKQLIQKMKLFTLNFGQCNYSSGQVARGVGRVFRRGRRGGVACTGTSIINITSPRILQQENAQGPMVVLGRGAVSYERGTPVTQVARGVGRILRRGRRGGDAQGACAGHAL